MSDGTHLAPRGAAPDRFREVPRRLAYGALGAAATFALALASEPLRPAGAAGYLGSIASAGLGLTLSLITFAIARRERLSPTAFLDLAVAFEISIGAVIWGMEFAVPFATTTHTPGVPTVAAWLLFFPVLVPMPARAAILASLAVILAGPAVMGLYVAAGHPAPALGHVVIWMLPAILCGAASVLAAHVVQSAWTGLRDARQRDQYVLLAPLGAGGMGEVFVARHIRLARLAAVKRIRRDALHAASVAEVRQRLDRFEAEARATARLRSPHTVSLFDFGNTEEGDLFYAMELLDGFDLQTLVDRLGPVSPSRTAHILRQACESLQEAHELGLVHRDIKPANLMLCRLGPQRDVLKVLDFGTVRMPAHERSAPRTRAGAMIGTPVFMAPEAQTGHAIAASDMYALGCVAWWLLTGARIHESDRLDEELARHRAGVVPSLHDIAPAPVDAGLEGLIRDLLAVEPNARPDAATTVARLDALALRPWTARDARAWWDAHGEEPIAARYSTRAPETMHFSA